MSKHHGMEMFLAKDDAHTSAMNEMKHVMQKPGAMADWFESRRKQSKRRPKTCK